MTNLDRLADQAAWEALADALSPWLVHQRWFAGKARRLNTLRVADVSLLGDTDTTGVAVVLVDAAYDDGAGERYQVPLVAASEHERTAGLMSGLALADASERPEAMRTLLEAIVQKASRTSAGGALLHGEPLEDPPETAGAQVRRLSVEQSNTSVVFGDRVILKLFRKLEEGLNPDVELTRGLTEQGFRHVPAQHGALLHADDGGTTALAVAAEFLSDAQEGWAVAVSEAARIRAGAAPSDEGLVHEAGALGEVIARMHLLLREAFGSAPAPPSSGTSWAQAMRAQAQRVLDLAQRSDGAHAQHVVALHDDVLAALNAPQDLADLGSVLRIHGDLHLGQVLLDDVRGWIVLDFEGEPARSLADRRMPGSPLRDVAGMLRSFDYAAAHGGAPTPALERWRDALRDAFLGAYLGTVEGTRLLPDAAGDRDGLLVAFELDKAVYELGYELANRPDWAGIPAGGIRRLLGTADRED